VLSGIATMTIVLVGPWLIFAIMHGEKATGMAALTATLLSPVSWVAFCLVFGLLWATGRLNNKALRIILFWIPTVVISTIGFAFAALILFVVLHAPKS
jgi:hypothetical protein